jgi:hypothetical protein
MLATASPQHSVQDDVARHACATFPTNLAANDVRISLFDVHDGLPADLARLALRFLSECSE